MTRRATHFVLSLFPLAALVAACGSAPGEATRATGEALLPKCQPFQDLECPDATGGGGDTGWGEGPGGSNVGGGKVHLGQCYCVNVTAPPDPSPPVPVGCGASAPIPSQLAGFNCTWGVTLSSDLFNSATVWACQIPQDNQPFPTAFTNLTSCANPPANGGLCEIVSIGPNIDNSCVGNAGQGWTLIETQTVEWMDGSGSGCRAGCPGM